MEKFHHFKIENNGKRSKFDVKLVCFDKDEASSSCGVSKVRRYSGARANQQRQLQSGEYEGRRYENSPTSEESESDSETDDMDSPYVDGKMESNFLLSLKANASKFTDKLLKRKDRYIRDINCQKEITKFFTKNKITKTVPKSKLKGPVRSFVYGLGSDFDREPSNSQEQLNSERYRFSTFLDYTGHGNHTSLARNGFYHDNNEGTTFTRCFRCALRHSEWTHNDDVPSVHRRLSPNCTFLNRYNSNAQHETMESSRYTSRTHIPERPTERRSTASGVTEAHRYINLAHAKLTRKYGNQEQQPVNQGNNQVYERSDQSYAMMQPSQGPNETYITEESGYSTNSQLPVAQLGLNPRDASTQSSQDRQPLAVASTSAVQIRSSIEGTVNNPKHPDQSSLGARMRTYQDWQECHIKMPEELAESGFFFTGSADIVRCFFCGIDLRHWAADDDPIDEHERWSPRCEYVRAVKEKRYATETAGQQGQLSGRADLRTDTGTLQVVIVMQTMGISADDAKKAVLAVRQQTGEYQVTPDQAVNWFLDNRSLGPVSSAEEMPPQAVASTSSTYSQPSEVVVGDNQGAVSVVAENQKLKELTSCKICMEQTMCITFLPCGHLLCCERCAEQVSWCPTCRVEITGTVKTFMPL